MKPTILTKHVTAVLKHQKDPLKALKIFNSVKTKDGFIHNHTTYKCIIENLGFHGEFALMEKMITKMRQDIDNKLLEGVYIFAIKSYGKKGKVQEAVNVFERMDFYGCEPSVYSYNVIMNVLVDFGYFDQAHKVYMRMIDKGVVPDVYSYTIRIKAFCRTRRSSVARRLLENVNVFGCELNGVAYCTVVGGFYEEGNGVVACEVFDEMLARGVFPSVVSFNKVIH
ncbi:putative pentatricopeptide repeat-containing protein, partial [Tanacetum coccineum]